MTSSKEHEWHPTHDFHITEMLPIFFSNLCNIRWIEKKTLKLRLLQIDSTIINIVTKITEFLIRLVPTPSLKSDYFSIWF